jgi:serine O-acetyltransferase
MWKALKEELKIDYERHGRNLRNPSFWLVASYRFGRWADSLPEPARKVASAAYGLMLTSSEFVLGSTLHRETKIGEGLHVVHADGIRIDPAAVLGKRVGLMQGVTIGTTVDREGAPVIGDDVFIGAGARILGPVRIGDRARIAANSLVINDVPADSTAIGVPAKVLRYTGRSTVAAVTTSSDLPGATTILAAPDRG